MKKIELTDAQVQEIIASLPKSDVRFREMVEFKGYCLQSFEVGGQYGVHIQALIVHNPEKCPYPCLDFIAHVHCDFDTKEEAIGFAKGAIMYKYGERTDTWTIDQLESTRKERDRYFAEKIYKESLSASQA